MTLAERANAVRTRDDFVAFIEALRLDCSTNGTAWANPDLPSFLDAAGAWIRDSDGYYRNVGLDPATLSPWRLLADILMAARVYE